MRISKLEITDNTSWHQLREQFSKQFNGASLMLLSHQFGYDDREEFSPLVSIIGLHAKTGTILCDDAMTIADFERACKQSFNLDIKVKAIYDVGASDSDPLDMVALRLKAEIGMTKVDSNMTLGELLKKQMWLNSMADLDSSDETVKTKAHAELYKRTASLLDPNFENTIDECLQKN